MRSTFSWNSYPILIEPDGCVYLAGDRVSHVNAWMQGALESAPYVTTKIHTRATQEIRPRTGSA
jgi:monoamine oxidase